MNIFVIDHWRCTFLDLLLFKACFYSYLLDILTFVYLRKVRQSFKLTQHFLSKAQQMFSYIVFSLCMMT